MSLILYGYAHVALHAQFNRRVVSLTIEKRAVAVLLAVQVILEREDVIGTVLIHWCVGVRTDDECGIGAVSDENDRHHQHAGVCPPPLAFFRVPNSPREDSDCQHKTHPHAGVERTSNDIHEEQFKPSDKRREARDNTVEDDQQHQARSEERVDETFPTELVFTEVIHESDSRYRQQVQEVYADAQTHQIRDKNQPTVRAFFVRLFVPFEDEPEHHRREERRTRIYLTLNRREPEGVAECVCERTYRSCTEDAKAFP